MSGVLSPFVNRPLWRVKGYLYHVSDTTKASAGLIRAGCYVGLQPIFCYSIIDQVISIYKISQTAAQMQ